MATMADVARLANVSLSTVSYVLSGTRTISAPTAKRVREAAEQLGYQRNALASGLAAGRTRIMALALPVDRMGFSAAIFEFVTATSAAAADAGYHLVLWPTPADDVGALEDLAKGGLADGVIVMEVSLRDPRVTALERLGLPYVMIGRTEHPDSPHYVDVDFEATINQALDMLTAQGHQTIHLVSHSRRSQRAGYGPVVRTVEAFEDACAARGLRTQVHYCEESAAEGAALVDSMVELAEPPTALVLMNEEAAYGVVNQLTRRGVSIPADISLLVIIASQGVATRTSPALTTLQAPAADLGQRAFRALMALIEDPADAGGHGALVPCVEMAGESVGPARQGTLFNSVAPATPHIGEPHER